MGARERRSTSTAAPRVYATFSAVNKNAGLTLSNGNLTVSTDSAAHRIVHLNTGKTSGKWAFEIVLTSALLLNAPQRLVVAGMSGSLPINDVYVGGFSPSVGWQIVNGDRYTNGSAAGAGTFDSLSAQNARALIVMDCDAKKIWCLKNGVLVPSGAITGTTFYGSVSLYDAVAGVQFATLNAGQSTFGAGNEAAMIAHESSTASVINRGVWA